MNWRVLVLVALVSAISLGKETAIRAETIAQSDSRTTSLRCKKVTDNNH